MFWNVQKDSAGATWPAIAVGVFVAFGGILYGYDTGTIGGILAMPYWVSHFGRDYDAEGKVYLGAGDKAMIVSILSVGTFFGALMAGPVADRIGRRLGLISSCAVFAVGVTFQTISTSIPLFVAGRFVAGWGVGMLSAQVPLYQSETAPKWIRGAIVGSYQLAITIGLLLASIANNITQARNDTGSYRIPVGIQYLWAVILVSGLLILPETPRFRVMQGRHEDAQTALAKLRRLPVEHSEIIDEINDIKASYEFEQSQGKASYLDLLKNGDTRLRTRLLTGMGLQALQQLTGINFIFYYGTEYFKSSGFSNAFTIAMITNCVNVLSTFPGLVLVEKWGRRNLLLFGAAGMAICQLVVATVGTTQSHAGPAGSVLIAFVCIYIFFFACSWGPIAWVVTGEIFPLRARAKALSITTATNWLFNWAIGYSTPYMVDAGPGNANMGSKVFFLWGACCCLCFAFVWSSIYETKGYTLEQVDEMYQKVPHAWQSKGFTPSDGGMQMKNGSLSDVNIDEVENVHIPHKI